MDMSLLWKLACQLFLLVWGANAWRQIIRCDQLNLGMNVYFTPLSDQLCAAGSNARYLKNIFVNRFDERNISLYDIVHGRAPGGHLSCLPLSETLEVVAIHNTNLEIDCSEDFIIYITSDHVAGLAVTHEQRDTQFNVNDGSHILLLSATGRIELDLTQGKENIESIRAGSGEHFRTIYTVGTDFPDSYVIFNSIVEIVPRRKEYLIVSASTDIMDERVLSPGNFVVVGSAAYPDARHLNGQQNHAVFKVNESVQIDTASKYVFDDRFHGGVELLAGGRWFNGTRVFDGSQNRTDKWSFYGDSFELRYLSRVSSSSRDFATHDNFAVEIRVKGLPPHVTEPASTTEATAVPTMITTSEAMMTSTTTEQAQPTDAPWEDAKYCACKYDHIWLDVVFLVDATDSMGRDGVDDVIAFIQSTLYQLSKGDRRFSTRAGIVSYGANSTILYPFSSLENDESVDRIEIPFLGGTETNIESAIRKASEMLSQGSQSRRAQKVIVLLATAFKIGSYDDPRQIARGFKESGGTIITVDYIEKDGIADPKLTLLATPTFAYNNTDHGNTFGAEDLLKAFCDVNCFCATNEHPFTMAEFSSRPGLPIGGCYEPVTLATVARAARMNCERKNASLPSIHSGHKDDFLEKLFSNHTQQWLGLQRQGGSFAWFDQSPFDYSHWPSHGNVGSGPAFFMALDGDEGFSAWFAAAPTKSAQYACQSAPCSALNDACLDVD